MFSIGQDEIDTSPDLGDAITCPTCGKTHPVEYGDIVNKDGTKTPSRMLAFYKCGKNSYLCGVNGKNIMR